MRNRAEALRISLELKKNSSISLCDHSNMVLTPLNHLHGLQNLHKRLKNLLLDLMIPKIRKSAYKAHYAYLYSLKPLVARFWG